MVKSIYVSKPQKEDWEKLARLSKRTKTPLYNLIHDAIKLLLSSKKEK